MLRASPMSSGQQVGCSLATGPASPKKTSLVYLPSPLLRFRFFPPVQLLHRYHRISTGCRICLRRIALLEAIAIDADALYFAFCSYILDIALAFAQPDYE